MKKHNSLFSRTTAPRKAKQTALLPEEISITGLSHEARGVAKHNGKTLFIAGALPGERVKFEIKKQHRRFDEADCTDVIEASPDRAEPICEHYADCGGCDLQHLKHEKQIESKQRQVLDQLARLGKFQPTEILPPLTSKDRNYRRSCRLGINQLIRDGRPIVGFRRKSSHKLLQIDNCPVLAEPLNNILRALPSVLATENNFKEITHAELSYGDTEGAMTLRVKKTPAPQLTAKLQQLAETNGFRLYFDNGQQITAYAGEAKLTYQHAKTGSTLGFQPGDFIQVNAAVNDAIVDRALDWLDPKHADRILDLFSGIGNFTLPIATLAGSVVGVEGVDEMVHRAGENARTANLNNCEFYRADLSQDLRALPWYKQGFNKALLDPPRTGALEVIKQLKQHNIQSLLYVSCNPAALARDGAELVKQGYSASKFCVADMFPHTSHVESLILFQK
ncbi:MAG: 23S rRNA (uracil(1939)-C(5))-methyltransferase RlmD [Neptuniibacter caesariensis]|uniref:23S rRNA (uracil(1939)-C(5))-methyltransferase RlmD n=1 Tax=Neptuniibacter caesariensis TaxID=207954 RepID=A0A2G6JLH3_NEPCE|nr:MAG: 23S rRNA (uracil(1939)-C(5))-methyltransferase RlmD [Neptuniibacter caesariensis]